MASPLPHRWSLGHNYLSGITLGAWWQLLRRHRIDGVYLHRAAAITALAALNSVARGIEDLRFRRRIAATEVVEPPVFVIGHWRSGTTHLHNLLALDRDRFTFPNTYDVVNPWTFLSTAAVNMRLFGWMIPDKRPMDDVAMSFDAPQEDELALTLMSLRSHYLGMTFPRDAAAFDDFLTFRDATEDDRRRWQDALRWFVRKLTLRSPRAVLLKSPPHTARLKLILDVFPDARFVHVHRHPFPVFRSCQRFFDTAVWHAYLQRPDRRRLDDEIIERYVALHDAYFDERASVPDGRLVEVGYDALKRDPASTLRTIYDSLELGDFDQVEPEVVAYTRSLAGYRPNRHEPLDDALTATLTDAAARVFDAWEYDRGAEGAS